MNKHLPLGEFERDVRRLADGFEIKPRGIVFDRVKEELAAGEAESGGGRLLRMIFSKSLSFVGYAAAAASLTVSSVFIVKQKIVAEEEQKVLNQLLSTRYAKVIPFNSAGTDSFATAQPLVINEETIQSPAPSNESPASNNKTSNTPTIDDTHTSPSTANNNPSVSSTEVAVTPKQKQAAVVASVHSKTHSAAGSKVKQVVAVPADNDKNLHQKTASARVSEKAPATYTAPEHKLTDHPSALNEATHNNTQANMDEPIKVKEEPQHAPVKDVVQAATPDSLPVTLARPAEVNKVDSGEFGKARQTDTTGNESVNALTYQKQELLKKGVWSFAVYHSFDHTTRKMESSSTYAPVESRDYNWLQRTGHNTQSSSSSGLKVEYIFSDHFAIGSGLNYIVRKDQLRAYDANAISYDSLKGTVVERNNHYYTSQWVPAFIGGEHYLSSTFHYLDVPLIFSYNNTIAGRFAVRLSAGGSYSQLLYAEGYYIQLNNPVSRGLHKAGNIPMFFLMGTGPSSPVASHVFNMQGGAYVSYLFNKRAEVFSGITLKRTLSSLYRKDYEVEQKFNIISMEVGVRYFVNGK